MPAETTRTLMRHGKASATVTIPMDYRRYHHLNPGARVRVIYNGFLLISVFVRRAVKTELAKLSFLPDRDKKALGVPLSYAEPSTKGDVGC